jgi:simple sugar transport system ATP-binding protein
MRGITKRFGEVLANDHISLAVRDKSIHAVIGENGAGKSTAMNILYGFYQADEGEILIDDEPRQINGPGDAIKLGLGMVHQHFMLVEPLTVTENIVLGAEPTRGTSIDYRAARARVREISEQYGLKIDPDARIADLSVGQQQRVEILKTLYRGARILILDEPTAVLTPQEVTEMFAILRGLREQGKTIIIITHKLAEVLALSDNITVMRDGRVVGNRPTAGATAEELARMMVGREVLLRVKKDDAKPREPVLTVTGLTLKGDEGNAILDGVSFEVRGGETLGIAGVEGNGQTELIEILAGLRKATKGEVLLEGTKINDLDPHERKQRGIAHIPEDRHRRGLILTFDLAANSILGVHRDRPITGTFLLNNDVINERAQKLVNEYDVRPPNITLPARSL